MTDKIVGHKTYRDGNGFRHEALCAAEASEIMAHVEAQRAKRASDMPTEEDAARALFQAWYGLK